VFRESRRIDLPQGLVMTSPRLLRVAVIGMGFVGPQHVDAVTRGGYGEVVAIGDIDPGRLATLSRDLRIPGTTDLDALLKDPTIDVVHICTPNHTHVPLAIEALEAGKHIVVEKPLAMDSASARQVVELAQRRRLHAMVSFTYRGYAMVREARELVATGKLGELRLIHGMYLQDWLTGQSDYNWRVEPALGGRSRAVSDIGSHWFDTTEWISGLRVTEVFADLATFLPTRERPRSQTAAFTSPTGLSERIAIASEDAATILVRFAGGARGACVVSQVSPGHKNDFTVEFAGSRQSLAWRQEEPERIWVGARDSSQLLHREPDSRPMPGTPALPAGHPEGWSGALRDLLRPFYAAVSAGEEPPSLEKAAPYPTLSDGARAVQFVEAVLASADESRWVPLGDDRPPVSRPTPVSRGAQAEAVIKS
jgi:predicted dehydrogenase